MSITTTNTEKITNKGAEILIDILSNNNTDKLEQTKLGEETITDRRETNSISNPSPLNSQFFKTTINQSNGKLIIKSELEVTEEQETEINNLNTIGIKTNNGNLIQYQKIDINFSDINF